MKILLTGATGYIGKRLAPALIEQGHTVICCVRDKSRFDFKDSAADQLEVYEIDFASGVDIDSAPKDFDIAFYLIHSMASTTGDFEEMESKTAENFVALADNSNARQIIYLGGIVNEENLSKHLRSRKNVEEILKTSRLPLTVLRAGIIIGSGSASFEIIRDLTEKLPVMVTPRWIKTLCQPVAIRDVIKYLTGVMLHPECIGQTFDIGGPTVLSYKEMMLGYARVRGLKRVIIVLPLLTPRLSAYWLYLITSTSYRLAVNLVNSMRVEVVCRDRRIEDIIKANPIDYEQSIRLAFRKIEQNLVLSSWKDAVNKSANTRKKLVDYIEVPTFGCFKDVKEIEIKNDPGQVLENIWSIGGERGWYYANFLWQIRGLIDRLFGGAGLRRGRTNSKDISPGNALDFWRVIVADKKNRRLLLYAEMKVPGEAWLEFRIIEKNGRYYLNQTATFRPGGLTGRLYWYVMLPFHYFIFEGMAKKIVEFKPNMGEKLKT